MTATLTKPPGFSIIGLGKVGLAVAAAIASRGFRVVGMDLNPTRLGMLCGQYPPDPEPAVADILEEKRTLLEATLSCDEAIQNSDISYLIVPTPSDAHGAYDLTHAEAAIAAIGRGLRRKSGYHLIVVGCTVLPGATRHRLLPLLQEESAKLPGKDFGLCYSPLFISLGNVIADFLQPDFTLIGEHDQQSGDILEDIYRQIVAPETPCRRMSIENAELTKLAVNSFVTTKITFANMLADLCERIPGGDVDVVTGAMGCDRRIGRAFFTAGLGYGGPCFPRDNRALSFLARSLDSSARLPETTDQINRSLPEGLIQRLSLKVRKGTRVAVLGAAYKPNCTLLEASQGIGLAQLLSDAGARVTVYDPMLNGNVPPELSGSITIAHSLGESVKDADIVLVATPDPEFKRLKPADLRTEGKVTLVDCWRLLKSSFANQPEVEYVAIGLGQPYEINVQRLESLSNGTTPVRTAATNKTQIDRASNSEKSYRHSLNVVPITWPSTVGGSINENLSTAERIVSALEPDTADFICFPEGFLYHGIRFQAVGDVVDDEVRDLVQHFGCWARDLRAYLFVPMLRRRNGHYLNAVQVIDRSGNAVASYEKMHPWPSDARLTVLEKGISAGAYANTVSTEFGPIGIQTCFDVNWSTGWDHLREHGSRLTVFPSEYPGGMALRARAWLTRTPIIAAVLRGGPSRVIDLSGEVLATIESDQGPTMVQLNLNKCLVHLDHNQKRLDALCQSNRELKVRRLSDDNVVLLEGSPDGTAVETLLHEFEISTLDEYLSNALRTIHALRVHPEKGSDDNCEANGAFT